MRASLLNTLCTTTTLLLPVTLARDTTFPPVAAAAIQSPQQQQPLSSPHHDPSHTPGSDNPLDLTVSPFGGLTTYANLPYQHCLSTSATGSAYTDARYDIAIIGAPFDTAVTGRPGARFGPQGIRRGSQRILWESAWDPYTLKNAFTNWAKVIDCGDVPVTWLDNTIALRQIDEAHRIISSRPAANQSIADLVAEATSPKPVPRILTLGGDHTTTLSALRSVHKHFGKVSVIHFDSHLDTWDPAVLGGGISEYAGVNHGTFLHIAHEEGLLNADSSVHAGMRCPLDGGSKRDLANDARCGFSVIRARDIDKIGIQGVIDAIRKRVGESKVYISVDIDVLDPAYAPATGTAEVGGWSTRELLSIIDGLVGLEVVGGDVVEVAPVYDNAGETTVLAAAEVAHSLITLMVEKPVLPVYLADGRDEL